MGNPVHLITKAATLLKGSANLEKHKALYDGRSGYVAGMPAFKLFTPLAIVAAGLINGATTTNLPNIATKTYTAATDGTAPLDNASRPATATIQDNTGTSRLVWVLDVPRNVSFNVTHASSIVALSLVVSGFDEYGAAMTETLAVTATGTTKTTAGKKAFKYILSYALTSAGNATTDTANLAWGNVFGLPYRVDAAERVLPLGNAIVDVSGTVTKADDTSPATTSTGDVRGTYAPNSAPDGTKKYAVWIMPTDDQAAQPLGLFGNVQA